MLEKLDSACATCLHGSMSRGVLPAPILPPLASLDPRLPPPLCAQILKGVFSSRYGTYKGAAIFQAILFIASNFCGTFCVTSNSRMLFAFARDHGVLGSRWWKQVRAQRTWPAAQQHAACRICHGALSWAIAICGTAGVTPSLLPLPLLTRRRR